MPRRSAQPDPDELREYHEAPPQLVRDMEQWLAVDDRREAAARVRAWLVESYALAPVKAPRRKAPPAKPAKARAVKRGATRGSSSR